MSHSTPCDAPRYVKNYGGVVSDVVVGKSNKTNGL